jgi:hypothetical protein
MGYRTRRKLKKLNRKLDALATMVAALVDEGNDREKARELTDMIKASDKTLQAVIPK